MLALRGEHQVGNALVAVRLLEAARYAGVHVERAAVEWALSSVDWPARLEMLALADGRRVLLDAAHNLDGAQALAAYLRHWHPQRPPLVLGVMRDKDVDDILRALLPVTSQVIATAAPTPRAMPADELAARIAAAGYAARTDRRPDRSGARGAAGGRYRLRGRVDFPRRRGSRAPAAPCYPALIPPHDN